MLEKDSTIQAAFDYAKSGKFVVHAKYDGLAVPEKDVARYQEDAWMRVKNLNIEELDEAYTTMLLSGTDTEDMTPDELLRYMACSTRTEYPNLFVDYILFTD